ncbi:hypothetical protein BROUX41_005702 [Berkeleyomyces rouxiae]|uniref:uncharacterized protein n=1 Tax=Berkeleyomyces rouxiae TaxID=2035830 RepID=UPI003B7D7011
MLSKLLAASILLVSCFFGARMTMFLGFHNGLFDVIGAAVSSPGLQTPVSATTTGAALPFPAGPQPFVVRYTGLAAIDRLLSDLIGYFTLLMHTPQTLGARAAWMYIMVQFYGIWQVLELEGYRVGNTNRVVKHTAILGLIFQSASLAFTLPLYLTVHILTAPATPIHGAFHVTHADLVAAPFAGFLAFTLPALGMGLPGMLGAPAYHYVSALWQIFPVTQSLWHFAIRKSLFSEVGEVGVKAASMYEEKVEETSEAVGLDNTTKRRKQTVATTVAIESPNQSQVTVSHGFSTAYRDAFRQGLTSQLLILSLIILSPETPYLPAGLRRVASEVTWSSVFLPFTFRTSPTVSSRLLQANSADAATETPLLGALALTFLQWDLFWSSFSYLTWVIYETLRGGRPGKRPSFWKTLGLALGWGLVGGPAAVGAVLLSKRDKENIKLTENGNQMAESRTRTIKSKSS